MLFPCAYGFLVSVIKNKSVILESLTIYTIIHNSCPYSDRIWKYKNSRECGDRGRGTITVRLIAFQRNYSRKIAVLATLIKGSWFGMFMYFLKKTVHFTF